MKITKPYTTCKTAGWMMASHYHAKAPFMFLPFPTAGVESPCNNSHTRKCPCWYPKWVGNVARSDEVVRVDLKEYWQSDGNRLKDCQTSCLYHHAYQHQWHSGIPAVQNVQLIFTKLPTAIVLDACLVWNPTFLGGLLNLESHFNLNSLAGEVRPDGRFDLFRLTVANP